MFPVEVNDPVLDQRPLTMVFFNKSVWAKQISQSPTLHKFPRKYPVYSDSKEVLVKMWSNSCFWQKVESLVEADNGPVSRRLGGGIMYVDLSVRLNFDKVMGNVRSAVKAERALLTGDCITHVQTWESWVTIPHAK